MVNERRYAFFEPGDPLAVRGKGFLNGEQPILNGRKSGNDVIQPLVLAMYGVEHAEQNRQCDLYDGEEFRRNGHRH